MSPHRSIQLMRSLALPELNVVSGTISDTLQNLYSLTSLQWTGLPRVRIVSQEKLLRCFAFKHSIPVYFYVYIYILCINSFRPDDAFLGLWTGQSRVKVNARRLFGTSQYINKPWTIVNWTSRNTLLYGKVDPTISLKIELSLNAGWNDEYWSRFCFHE